MKFLDRTARLVASGLTVLCGDALQAQPTSPQVTRVDPPCVEQAKRVDEQMPPRDSLWVAMRCDGDRVIVAKALWRSHSTDSRWLRQLQEVTVEHIDSALVMRLTEIAREDSSGFRRFGAFGVLARIIDGQDVFEPSDTHVWGDTTRMKLSARLHVNRRPSPIVRTLVQQQMLLLSKDAPFDVRRAAEHVVRYRLK